jgi:mannose-6-phosphate isomerase-like protein (cupin superfamily)
MNDRPWGYYKIIDNGEGYQVKRLFIKPEGKLSLQSHKFRSELWIIVSGNPSITKGEMKFISEPGKWIHIDKGEKHRIENLSDKEIIIIEVQMGSYLGEDDIVRYDDIYGRI